MMDRVSTEILGLLGGGRVGRYGDCAQWLSAVADTAAQSDLASADSASSTSSKSAASTARPEKSAKSPQPKGLTASEQSELRDMEDTIHEADQRIAELRRAFEDPSVAGDHVEVQKRWSDLQSAQKHLESLYARWEHLESRRN
jgi:ATP-binding cassette subfamily F protein uup